MSYIKHIDGLRAVAIISVILFHLNLDYFKGGFVGVDIFFVISGFLITQWFVKRSSIKNFSLLKIFFENRIKRLIPLLFFVKIIILIFGFILMNSYQYKLLIDQNLYSLFFLSNIYLWKNSDYFSLNTFENPLVHTWSLSLEEQFYIFFSIFFIFINYFLKKKKILIIFIVGFLSLLLAQSGGNLNFHYPFLEKKFYFFNESVVSGYFLIFGRIWEFFIGAIFFLKKNSIEKIIYNKRNLICNLSFLVIIGSIFILDETYQYPSIWTLPVTIAAALIILAYNEKNIQMSFLVSKPLMFTGLISFSLYLWHQPIFAFSRISIIGFESSAYIIFLEILIIYGLSILSFKYIERPFKQLNYKKNNIITLFCISFIIFILINVLLKNELVIKIQDKINFYNQNKIFIIDIDKEKNNFKQITLKNNNSSKEKIIFLIGDSMSTNWVGALNNIEKKKYKYEHIILDEICFEYLTNPKNVSKQCSKDLNNFLHSFKQYEYDNIQHVYFLNNFNKNTLKNIYYVKDFFKSNPNKITFVGNSKFKNLPLFFSKISIFSIDILEKEIFNLKDKKNLENNKKIEEITKKLDFNYLNNYDFFCIKNKCKVFDNDNNLFFWDNDHLTKSGLLYLSNKLIKKLEE